MADVGRLNRHFADFTEEIPVNLWKFSNETIVVHVNTSLRGVVNGLKPWTTYDVTVAGYNNVGLSNLRRQRVTTLDSSK